MASLLQAITVLCLAGTVLSQALCGQYGGTCSSLACTRYYVPPSERMALCPYAQRCCVADSCSRSLKGVCVNRYGTCPGGRYTHFGTSALCRTSYDVCCVVPTGRVTPKPAVTPKIISTSQGEECNKYNGVCQNQRTTCVGGTYHLLKNSKVLCNDILVNRCCIPNGSGSITTPAPRITPSTQGTCGVPKVTLMQKRIVGGQPADRGEWPWQVSITKASSSFFGATYMHTCGGTLIAPQWVLSAAHCFTKVRSLTTVRVKVGEHSFLVDEDSESSITVNNIITHRGYVASNNKNDIALIKLSSPVDMSGKYVNTACLPVVADMAGFYRQSACYSTGWGNTQGTGDKNVLREVDGPLVSQATCYRNWGTKIDSTKVCFGDGVKQPCRGDSGGPLVCKKDNKFYLVGVVSYGSQSCTQRYVPTVFTNVAAYSDWISQTMAAN